MAVSGLIFGNKIMLDTSQLQDLKEHGAHYQRQKRFIRNRALIVVLIGLIVIVVIWQQVRVPVMELETTLDGVFWVDSSSGLRLFYAMFAFIVLLVLCMFIYWIPLSRLTLERTGRTHKLVMSLLPQMPEYNSAQYNPNRNLATSRWRYVMFFGLCLVAGLILGALELPSLVEFFLLGGLVLGFFLFPSFMRLRNPDVDENSRTHIRRNLPFSIIYLALMIITIFGLMSLLPGILMQWIHDELIAYMIGNSIALLMGVLVMRLLPLVPFILFYRGAYKRADYADALRDLEKVRPYVPHASYLSTRANVNTQRGQYAEAESDWLAVLTEYQHAVPYFQSICLSEIGYTVQAQGRSEEAEKYFKAALDIAPDENYPYLRTALYAVRTNQPALALSLIEPLPAARPRPVFNYLLQRYNWTWGSTIMALVYAVNGRREQAEKYLSDVLNKEDANFVPGWSMINALVAETYQQLGNPDAAQEHARRAQTLDRVGAGGQRAETLLTEWNIQGA
jgi:tetratricopeptide (TPR) repeat protein